MLKACKITDTERVRTDRRVGPGRRWRSAHRGRTLAKLTPAPYPDDDRHHGRISTASRWWHAGAVLCITLPWLWPLAGGPSAATLPWLASCASFALLLAICALRLPDIGKAATHAWLIAALVSCVIALLQYFGVSALFKPWINVTAAGEAFANLRQRNQFATLTNIGLAALAWGMWARRGYRAAIWRWMRAMHARAWLPWRW